MCHSTACGYEQHAMPAPVWHHQESCCCCGSGHAPRRFRTIEEVAGELEEHLKQLKAEAVAVEERLADVRKKG